MQQAIYDRQCVLIFKSSRATSKSGEITVNTKHYIGSVKKSEIKVELPLDTHTSKGYETSLMSFDNLLQKDILVTVALDCYSN